jgi:hypothetical protein
MVFRGDLAGASDLVENDVARELCDDHGRAGLDGYPLVAGRAEEPPRVPAQVAVDLEAQLDDLDALRVRALADERHAAVQVHVAGRVLDALVRIAKRRLVERDALVGEILGGDPP